MNKLSFLIIFLFSAILVNAQYGPSRTYAPYSQGNLGVQNNDLYTKNFGIGNVGIANSDKYSPNLINPSLLVKNKFTILDVNFGFKNETLEYNGSKQYSSSGSLTSINVVMPFSYKWTSAFSLTPYSTTNYGGEVKNLIPGTTDTLVQSDSAYGSIQRVTWSNGFNIYKDLNVGVSASYSFGDITKDVNSYVMNQSGKTVYQKDESNYSGFDYKVGASYEKEFTLLKVKDDVEIKADSFLVVNQNGKIKKVSIDEFESLGIAIADISDTIISKIKEKQDKKLKIGLGATYSSPLSWYNNRISRVNNTIYETSDTSKLAVNMPTSIGVGLSIGNVNRDNNWMLAFDYEMTSGYEFESGNIKNSIPKSSRMAVGFQITPQIESENFFKNATYSLGAYQSKTPYKYAGEQLDEVGIHFGLSFADRARRSNESFRWREKSKTRLNYLSRYNVGVGVGMLGSSSTSSIQQAFIKFNFGISLNSEWFVRRKIN